MTRCTAVILTLSAAAVAMTQGCRAEPSLSKFRFEQAHLGTYVRLVFYAPSGPVANRAAESAFQLVRELDGVFSNYRLDSELMRLCTEQSTDTGHPQPVVVSDELWHVLVSADGFSRASEGAFDVTVGPLSRLWKRAIRRGVMPDTKRLRETHQSCVGYQHIVYDESAQSVRLMRSKMRIDLGGIAKGFIADQVLKSLDEAGLPMALVDIGGDLAIGDPPPGKNGWTVAVNSGESLKGIEGEYKLSNCGVATSGDAYQYVEIEGRRYSHLIDPRTGMGVMNQPTVTTLAADCMTADAFASMLSVLSPAECESVMHQFPGVSAMVISPVPLKGGDSVACFGKFQKGFGHGSSPL